MTNALRPRSLTTHPIALQVQLLAMLLIAVVVATASDAGALVLDLLDGPALLGNGWWFE